MSENSGAHHVFLQPQSLFFFFSLYFFRSLFLHVIRVRVSLRRVGPSQ
jgi:hypothetical protein